MSPSTDTATPLESRVQGLYAVRRWLIQLLLSEAWAFAALAAIIGWPRLTTTDRALLAASALCIVVGWLLTGRTAGLWIITAAPLCLVLAGALNDPSVSTATWIALAVSIGHVTYATIMLTPARIGLAAIAIGALVLIAVWSRRPSNVVPGALAVAGGWIAVLSLVVSAFTLWYLWHSLLKQARAADDRLDRLASRVANEIAAQERSKMWRATVVAVHERLLSTLRYLLQADRVDREGLASLARSASDTDGASSTSELAEDVREATAARIAAGIVRVDPSVLDLPITEEARIAARAAIVECSLNAVLHGGATDVHVSASQEPSSCRIQVSDNGSGIDPDAIPGLGWRTTLDEGLAAQQGSWSVGRVGERTVVAITLPTVESPSPLNAADDGFQQGRLLISGPLLAVGLVGSVYSVVVGLSAPLGWPLILTAILSALGAIALVARRRRPGLLESTAVIAGLAGIPWLMALADPGPTVSGSVVAGLTTAGYALIAVGVWSRWWQWTIGLLAWAGGVLIDVSFSVPQDAFPIMVALVNCLVIVPVVVIVSSIGARRFRRAQAALAVERDAMNREIVRANSARVIDQHLSACVAQADSIIAELAQGADLSDERRHEVACLEGLIRATIQVDPVDSGEFTRVAGRLVNTAFSMSVPAQVGTLVSSPDTTPLDATVVRELEGMIRGSQQVTVRTVSDGLADHLSLELRHPAPHAHEAAHRLGRVDIPHLTLEVSEEAGGAVMVVLSRPVRVPATV